MEYKVDICDNEVMYKKQTSMPLFEYSEACNTYLTWISVLWA